MKHHHAISGAALFALVSMIPACSDAYKQRYIARHVLGYNEEQIALVGRAKAIPFDDLKFDVKLHRKTYTIQISSAKWEILGFGTCFSGSDLSLDGIAGIPNPSGGMKSYTDNRTPGRKVHVTFLNDDGTQREIFRER